MNSFEFMRIRRALGKSCRDFAEILGLEGKNRADYVREIGQGRREVTPTLAKIAGYLAQGCPEITGVPIPKILICHGPIASEAADIVFHTYYPRFLAEIAGHDLHPLLRIDFCSDAEFAAALSAARHTLN